MRLEAILSPWRIKTLRLSGKPVALVNKSLVGLEGAFIRRYSVVLLPLLLSILLSLYALAFFNGWLNGRPDFLPDKAKGVRVYLGGPYGFTMDGFEATKAKISDAEFHEIVERLGLVSTQKLEDEFSGFESSINRWWWDPNPKVQKFVNQNYTTTNIKICAQYHNGNLYFVRSWGY